MQRDRAASSSPFGTPQPPGRGRSELQNPSTGKPPRHAASSVSKDSARRSSARNLASSALMSPGVDAVVFGRSTVSPGHAGAVPATPHCDGKKGVAGSESPFREWATNSLGCLADVVSPERDDAVMLPPSYPELRAVKLENSPMASRDEDLSMSCKPAVLEHSLTEAATAFPPSGLGQQQGTKLGDKATGGKKSIKKGACGGMPATPQQIAADPQIGGMPEADELASPEALGNHPFTPPAPVHCIRKPMTLIECHLFTFELCDNKVTTDGFEDTDLVEIHGAGPASSRIKSRRVPLTPALGASTPENNQDGGSGSRKRICSCKKSRCLKLYCECFAAGELCGGCKCFECANDGQHEPQRLQAVENIKQRNSNAFAPKIVDEEQDRPVGAHARGCRCKKSHCLKKYCECFQAQVKCTDKCKCEECKNMSTRPDETPRERAEQALAAFMNPQSGSKGSSPDSSGRHTGRKGGQSALSPARNKKPRVLDFNVMATPSHSTPSSALRHDIPGMSSPSAMLIKALVP